MCPLVLVQGVWAFVNEGSKGGKGSVQQGTSQLLGTFGVPQIDQDLQMNLSKSLHPDVDTAVGRGGGGSWDLR